jgi:hypothetical protein
MQSAPLPANETARIADLRELKLLDIALIDDNRQWFKSKCGLTTEQTGRAASVWDEVRKWQGSDKPLDDFSLLEIEFR